MIIPMAIPKKLHVVFYKLLLVVLLFVAAYYVYQYQTLKRNIASQPVLSVADAFGITPEFPRVNNTNDWNTYKNTLAGYEIKYPKDWSITEESFEVGGKQVTESSAFIDLFPSNIMKDFLFKITIEAIPTLISDSALTPEETWNRYSGNFQLWSLKDKKISEVDINGTKYTLTEGVSTESGIPEDFLSKTYVTKINDGKGVMVIISRDRSVPRSGLFDQIIETIRFTK